ncbi:hypothetical protein ES703_118249 [subsurface metagenome]
MQTIVTKVLTDSYRLVINDDKISASRLTWLVTPFLFNHCRPNSGKLSFKLNGNGFVKFGTPCVHPDASQVVSNVGLPECFPRPLDIVILPAPNNVSGQDNPVFFYADSPANSLKLLPGGDLFIYHGRVNLPPFQCLSAFLSYQPAILTAAIHITLVFLPGQLLESSLL